MLSSRDKNANLSYGCHIYRNNTGKCYAGGVGAAKKTSPELPAVGDDGNRQNLAGGRRPDHIT